MSDYEFVKKMIRSVVQSKKEGVSLNSFHSEYRSLCGEPIPLAKLGYSKLEDFLRNMPSVVRIDYYKGELKCFAVASKDTSHIAELIAKQKSSKKSGHSHVVNCKMRFKPSNPYTLSVGQMTSLRQPRLDRNFNSSGYRFPLGLRGCSASGDYRQFDQKLKAVTPLHHQQPASQLFSKRAAVPDRVEKLGNTKKPGEAPPYQVSTPSKPATKQYDVALVQSRITQLLKKYYSGVWMSKVADLYSEMFNQKLPPQALTDMENWTHICMVEKHSNINQRDQLLYPPLPSLSNRTTRSPPVSPITLGTVTSPPSPNTPEHNGPSRFPATPPKKSILAKPTFIFPPKPGVDAVSDKVSFTLQNPANTSALAPKVPPRVHQTHDDNNNLTGSDIGHKKMSCPSSPTCASVGSIDPASHPDRDALPSPKVGFSPPPNSVPAPPYVVPSEVRQRIEDLLSKYSMGLWAHALPKLFMDTYKAPFPDYILDNLSLLLHFCSVEYTSPHNKKKAILYKLNQEDNQDIQPNRSHLLPSGLEVIAPVVPPKLVPPSEQFLSVLVTEAKSSNAVTIRYVGRNYSDAQEAMEDRMAAFYSQTSPLNTLSNPTIGQLVAVRGGEAGKELARAQILEIVSSNKVKVYYLDYGFSLETSTSNLLKLHQDFTSLPFQATNVKLAGLEAFSSDLLLLSSLEKMAVEKILLMETLEHSEQNKMPLVVLYDTSQDEDININSSCLKALQDDTMNNPLQVGGTYPDVCVTNVCEDGIVYCQLPSRGMTRLNKLLESTEGFFFSQMTSEYLVSKPFTGKLCLARYKGKWARVQIINMYGNRVVKIFCLDMGVSAAVEITDLREIPSVFLKSLIVIPPQAVQCRLADLPVPESDWTPEAVRQVKEAVQASQRCKMKVLKLDQYKEEKLVYMYLFVGGGSQELHNSINHQLARSELWQKLATQNSSTINRTDTGAFEGDSTPPSSCSPAAKISTQEVAPSKVETPALPMPPPLALPQPGHNMDVFVPVACHPGYFVVQRLEDLRKLTMLTGEMMLYYDQMERTNTATSLRKGDVYAAKIDKSWHRVQVKGILTNGLVSVYELDHGKHELIRNTVIQPLIEDFRQLPFQAIAAQLAGVKHGQWSEEASMLFRNNVENRPLIAQVESVQEMPKVKGVPWERRLTVYLVDTSLEDEDLWIHSIMADIKH